MQNLTKNEIIYYDSANIAESYSGIVLPLTCSFATKVYSQVYKNLLNKSGVSFKKINNHQDIFENMLGVFYGRVYYNMNNWYRMTAFLPGHKRNKKNLEKMITSNISESIDYNIHPSFWLRIAYPFIFLLKLFLFPYKIKKFKNKVREYIVDSIAKYINNFSLIQCLDFYKRLEDNLLNDWYRTVENDFMVMSYLGLIGKIYPDNQLKDIIKFNSQSTKQIEALKNMSVFLKSNSLLWQSITSANEQLFKRVLLKDNKIKKKIDDYFLTYGGRFANELKLESSDIETDFKKFSDMVKIYSQTDVINSYQEILKHQLSGNIIKRVIGKVILKRFKKYSSQREELRLLRSNVFAIVRKIFKQIGELYTKEGYLSHKNDIFYLKINDIFFQNDSQTKFFKKIVDDRKKEYKNYTNINPSSHFSVRSEEIPIFNKNKKQLSEIIKGKLCVSGKIQGRVKIFKDFYMPENIDFDIMVASRTDPGWTALIGVVKGMIIENGGLLSHAAIVARELGIPTIIGATDATRILKDDQIVELDGISGNINIIK